MPWLIHCRSCGWITTTANSDMVDWFIDQHQKHHPEQPKRFEVKRITYDEESFIQRNIKNPEFWKAWHNRYK